MITAIRAWIDKYEILVMLALLALAFCGGLYVCGIFHKAGETEDITAELTQHIKQEKYYQTLSQGYEKLNASLLKDQQSTMDKAHETKDPDCGSKSIPDARMRLLRQSRASGHSTR